MSIKLLSAASELDFKNEPLLKFVLFALCNYANSDDEAWPSYPTISKFCSISESTAYRSIEELEKRGYIQKTKRVHKNKRSTSNLYKININPTLSPRQGDPVTQTPQTLSHRHPSKENHHKEPLLEPIVVSDEPTKNPIDELFDSAWDAYPNKSSGKKLARERFKKIPNVQKEYTFILGGIKRYKEYVERRRKTDFESLQYKLFGTWLGQREWDSEYKIEKEKIDETKKPVWFD